MTVWTDRAGFMCSAVSAEGAGSAIDNRTHANFGFWLYWASGHSAIMSLQASPTGGTWFTVATVTATATQTGTAQISAFYPMVRTLVSKVYSAAGGSGVVWSHYTPGFV